MICRLSKGAVCTVCSMFKCDVTTFYMCLNYRFMLCCLPLFWNHRFKYFLYNTQTKATEMTQLIDSASWKYCKQSFTGVCWKGILSCKCGKQLTYWNNLPCDDYIIDICVFNTFFLFINCMAVQPYSEAECHIVFVCEKTLLCQKIIFHIDIPSKEGNSWSNTKI